MSTQPKKGAAAMDSRMLADLSTLFSFEALESDLKGDFKEAERRWKIADKLSKKSGEALLDELGATTRR